MTLLTDSALEQARRIYPTGLVRLHILLDDLGQRDPGLLLDLPPFTPLSWTVEHNASAEADTADITLDGSDFPFDPAIVNAATVELYQANAGQLDSSGTFWSKALNPPVPDGLWKVQTTPDQDRAAQDQIVRDTVCLFMGVVDEWEWSFPDDGKVRLHLKCRDFTAYFIDAPPTKDQPTYKGTGSGPDGALSLKEVIEGIVKDRPKTRALQVVRWPEYDPPAPVYPALYDLKAQSQGNTTGKHRNKESLWALIQEMALAAGRIVIVHLDRILIMEPATIFTGAPRPNVDRWLDQNGRPLKPVSFRFVLGFDLVSFSKRRLMGRRQATNVVCISYVPSTRKRLVSEWVDPDNKAEKASLPVTALNTDPASDIQRDPAPAITFDLRHITSQKQLDEIARQLGEQIRNREIEAELETADMVDAEGQSLVGLRYGMPVYVDYRESLKQFVAFDPRVQAAQLVLHAREDGISTGLTPDQADKLVTALNNLQLPFYLHRCTHRFDPDGRGYRFSAELRSRHQVVINE